MGVEPGLGQAGCPGRPRHADGLRRPQASGVGVVVSSKGYVLVPASLVTDADDIGVFIDGQQLPATLVGVDPGTGLAVVRVHSIDTLTAVSFASGNTIGYGSFVALVWVDDAGTHTCWGTVSDARCQA